MHVRVVTERAIPSTHLCNECTDGNVAVEIDRALKFLSARNLAQQKKLLCQKFDTYLFPETNILGLRTNITC